MQLLNVGYMALITRVLGHFLRDSVPFYSARFMVRQNPAATTRLQQNILLDVQSAGILLSMMQPVPTACSWSAFQVWEIATTVGGLAGGGLLQTLDGSAMALWNLRALGTRVDRGACIFGSRYDCVACICHVCSCVALQPVPTASQCSSCPPASLMSGQS